MKLNLIAFLFFLGLAASAQEQKALSIYLGLDFGSEASFAKNGFPTYGPGVNIGMEYRLKSQTAITSNFSYFFESEYQSEGRSATNQISAINLMLRHYFHQKKTEFYGFYGASLILQAYSSTTTEQGKVVTKSCRNRDIGYCFGLGMLHPLSDRIAFGSQLAYQADYQGAGVVQLVLNASLNYRLK